MEMPKHAGWFDDPADPTQLRYFDGVIWTKNTAPRSTRAASTGPQLPGQQAYPGQGHPPQYPGQVDAPGAGQPGTGQPGAPGAPAPYVAPGAGSSYPQPPNPQFPGAPQQGGWNAPAYPGFATRPTTPDGQPLAGYWQRVGAFVIDAIITGILTGIIGGWFLYRAMSPFIDQLRSAIENNDPSALQGVTPDFDYGSLFVFSVISTAIYLGYHVFFLSRTGATPGKAALGISVRLRERPGALTPGRAARRTALQAAVNILGNIPVVGSLASLVSLLDLLWPAWDDKKQALHDKIAATNVVVGKQPRR